MKCYIREIAIFSGDGEKRGIDNLIEGLNIITGDSQTGKSALLEIVDYCLLASRSTIPRGKIIEFADLFAIVLELKDKYIVLGRPSPKVNPSKLYFKLEFSESAITNLQKSYFDAIDLVPRNTLKKEFGRFLGFDVTDTTLKINPFQNKEGRASLRNMTPYLFQHQSLIANKHAMFYRFDDRDVRERIVNEFPIFMGWVEGEYYYLSRELSEKERNLRRLKREIIDKNKNEQNLMLRLNNYLNDYYKIIGIQFPQTEDMHKVVKLARNLPEFSDKSYITGDFEGRLVELNQKRDKLSNQKIKIKKEIQLLETASSSVIKHNIDMFKLSERSENNINNDIYNCPLCKQKVKSFNEKVESVKRSRDALFADLRKLKNYSIDNSETIEKLRRERDEINQEILTINGEIKILNKAFESGKNNYDLKQRAMGIKHLIELSLEVVFGDSNLLSSNEVVKDLEDDIRNIKNKLKKYDMVSYRAKFDSELDNDMNQICSKLDFEKELGAPNLKFHSENFDFYHELDPNNRITLSEMGSGANWLACHLSLMLGLHKQFAKNVNCSVPSFIFLDQPSQVYFPKYFDRTKDKDVRNVEDIFDVIIETIERIEKEAGFKPQVIVTDHADNLELKNGDFNSYVRKRWGDYEKLI
jgi:hypothetical protein